MYKIIENNQIIDVMETLRFVKYLPKTQRSIEIGERQANGILSSNKSIIYHIDGTSNVFPEGYKTVTYDKIALGSLEEFGLSNYTDVTVGQGTPYPIITDDSSRKFNTLEPVDIPTYWTRTTGNGNVHQWYYIDLDGRRATGGGANYNRIAILISI